MLSAIEVEKEKELEKNIVFVGTIYDSFEALEETLGKLRLEQPLFMIHAAKKAFAAEVIRHSRQKTNLYAAPKKNITPKQPILH